MLGGAANVAANISSLGGAVILCGVVGYDKEALEIKSMIKNSNIMPVVISESHRPTTVKTRIVSNGQQIVRVDNEINNQISKRATDRILEYVKSIKDKVDIIIISDYAKGVISNRLIREILFDLEDTNISVVVDPEVDNFDLYEEVYILTPNHLEAGEYTGIKIIDEESLQLAGETIIRNLACDSVLITQGPKGMTLFEDDGKITHIPTVAQQVFDVSGAGDTVISTLAVGLATGLELKIAAELANTAAGIVVGKTGTSAITIEELKEKWAK